MKALGKTLLAILIIALVGGGVYLGVFRRDLFKKPTYTVTYVCEDKSFEDKTVEVNSGEKLKLPTPQREGYTFDGWFNGDKKWTNDMPVKENLTLTAKWKIKNILISFQSGENSFSNTFSLGEPLPVLTKEGYNFDGWFTALEGGEKIEVASADLANTTLYSRFSLQTYSITYILDGGQETTNPTSFTAETPTFTLAQPTKENNVFEGWSGTGIDGISKTVTIIKGTNQNLVFTANWIPEVIQISFIVDGKKINKTATLQYGETLASISLNAESLGLSGYTLSDFYSDSSMQTKQDLTTPLKKDTILYLYSTYIIDNGFYDYLSKFKAASNKIEIKSFNELVSWIDYVLFNNITSSKAITASLTYKTFSTTSKLLSEVSSAISQSTFSYKNTAYSYWEGNTKNVKIYVNNDMTNEAQKVYDEGRTGILSQNPYALSNFTKTRSDSFNDFNIYNVTKTLEVSTSNQLVYALEKGLRPVCVPGSKAEMVFEKAKKILRDICNDDMTNVEKARVIYEWIILNNSYDHKAADEITGNNWFEYDSWFAEGVFISKKAVCDGICKAFLIMAKIEGIPTIRVTGNAHAWNKVYLNGAWFGVDATHGDLSVSGSYEALTYTSFLFTDEYKRNAGFTSEEYPNIIANTVADVYGNIKFDNNGKPFDLLIGSMAEFDNLLNYIKANVRSSIYTFEIAIDPSGSVTASQLYSRFRLSISFSLSQIEKTDSAGNKVIMFIKN